MTLNRRTLLTVACATAAATPLISWGQEYPNKPIKIIVPLPPGGSNDVLARTLGQKIGESMGQPVIVENKPGAAGNIATDALVKSEPDGYTLAIAPNQTVAVNPVLYSKLPFNVLTDVQGISMLGSVPMVLVVHPSVAVSTVGELVAMAKNDPQKLSYASAGAGSPQHMAAEVFKSMSGVNITHIPYKLSLIHI